MPRSGRTSKAAVDVQPAVIGRPSTFTQELADVICDRLANGESLNEICNSDHIPAESTVRGWVVDNAGGGFAAKYTRARDIALDREADEITRIADDSSEDPRSRQVRIDARKWRLSKMAPKRYGERLELAGDKDAPLTITVRRLDK